MPDGSYGIQLFNKYGHNIATVNDINFSLRSSGQIHNWQFGKSNPAAGNSVTLDLTGFTCPIVFLKPMSADQRVSCVAGNEREFTGASLGESVTVEMKFSIYKWWNKDVGTMQYYVFDRWIPPERSRHGLQLFNRDGSLVFDSGWYFMKIRNVFWLDPGYPNHSSVNPEGANWTVIGSAGAGNLAMAMPVPRGWITWSWTGNNGTYLHECFHFSDWDNKITISLVPRGEYLWTPPRDGWANTRSRSQVMVIDVDGLPTNYRGVNVI
ncbi:hypothetical protein SME22J_27530 [Serratia marcescens]|nr:hypothetical protein SME22J_27530 [Serratia marcescens]